MVTFIKSSCFCSMFAELRSLAKVDNPQPTVETFLNFHVQLRQACSVIDSLAKTRISERSLDDQVTDLSSVEEAQSISSGKTKECNFMGSSSFSY